MQLCGTNDAGAHCTHRVFSWYMRFDIGIYGLHLGCHVKHQNLFVTFIVWLGVWKFIVPSIKWGLSWGFSFGVYLPLLLSLPSLKKFTIFNVFIEFNFVDRYRWRVFPPFTRSLSLSGLTLLLLPSTLSHTPRSAQIQFFSLWYSPGTLQHQRSNMKIKLA